jgi:hypothetical protein
MHIKVHQWVLAPLRQFGCHQSDLVLDYYQLRQPHQQYLQGLGVHHEQER